MTKRPVKKALNLRGSEEAVARLEKLTAKYPLTKHAIARIALDRGLDAIESDPKWFEKAKKP
jgi:hypothetical protein